MALDVGSRLGHYDVTALIGAGGMGEVYQATDTKLNRQVALKILPEAFAEDPDRLARFQREAQVLASLNHPNIAQIHGIEEAEGTRALVLELVEGPTLADRIAQGPIQLEDALPIAKQIAAALEAAHEAGVIHRDLKPANIKVREDGAVKVLDFGLAKATEVAAGDDPSESPTTMAAATQMGMIMGTAAYMSPEQARGRPVDKRSDIWLFGIVLYEMLAGAKPFPGDDVSLTLARVLEREVDWSALPGDLPVRIHQTLRVCLQKDPEQRVRDIAAVRLTMDGAFETAIPQPREAVAAPRDVGWRWAMPWVAGLVAGSLVTGAIVWRATRPAAPRVVRFAVSSSGTELLSISPSSRDLAISSDGRLIAYFSRSGTADRLLLRSLDQLTSTALVADGLPRSAFFSPDDEWVGFFDQTSSELKRVSVRGGPALTISDTPGFLRGASWGSDDTIIFATLASDSGLWRVRAGGGTIEQLTTPDAVGGELDHLWPEILPGGEAVLFTITADPVEDSQIGVLSLDSLEKKVIVRGGFNPSYSPTGHLVYGIGGTPCGRCGSIPPVWKPSATQFRCWRT